CAVPGRHAASGARGSDRQAPWRATARRVRACRRGAEIAALRREVALLESPPRGRHGGGGDTGGPGSTAWWGRHWPSAGCDAPVRPEARTGGTGRGGADSGAPAAEPPEWSVSVRRPPPPGRPGRGASPHGSRRTPGAGTSPPKRARRARAPTGRTRRGPPARPHRREPQPGSARPESLDPSRDEAPSRRSGPARPPAAGPWSEAPWTRGVHPTRRPETFPRKRFPFVDTASRAP